MIIIRCTIVNLLHTPPFSHMHIYTNALAHSLSPYLACLCSHLLFLSRGVDVDQVSPGTRRVGALGLSPELRRDRGERGVHLWTTRWAFFVLCVCWAGRGTLSGALLSTVGRFMWPLPVSVAIGRLYTALLLTEGTLYGWRISHDSHMTTNTHISTVETLNIMHILLCQCIVPLIW